MTEQQSSYRQIVKATSLFGGVQVFQIIIRIIRSKFIAVLLGPTGMGIAGLLSSTTGFIEALTSFGLGTSAVKDVASAHGMRNPHRIAVVIRVLRRMVWITGTVGLLITMLLSPWLSELTFSNRDYTLAFVWISVTLLFNQLSKGQMVVLQGMRKLEYLAKANLSGSLLGLIITVPLYYWLRVDGIVPGMIITSFIALSLSWFYAHKITIEPIKVSYIRTLAESRHMITLGFMISLSNFVALGGFYIIRIYIRRKGGLDQVGLYNAGFAIISTYVGLVFTAMGTDYYPRLSAVAWSNAKAKEVINQQAEVALLILAPIIMVFLVFIKWVIILLYSSKFISVNDMIQWAAMGMLFKAASWSITFILLAKGASKLFFINELIRNIYFLGLNILGFYFWGLTGMGISFFLTYIIHLIQMIIVSRFKYEFAFNKALFQIFGIQFLLTLVCFLLVKLTSGPYCYILGSILIIISLLHSFKELDKRLDLKSIIITLKNKI